MSQTLSEMLDELQAAAGEVLEFNRNLDGKSNDEVDAWDRLAMAVEAAGESV